MSKKGFTLIELLVVIAIIALLLAILLPALNKVKMQAKTAVCKANCRSMAIAWSVYAMENADAVVSSFTGYGVYSDPPLSIPSSPFCPNPWVGWAGYPNSSSAGSVENKERQIQALEQGKLYPYLETPKVYRCPASRKYELRAYSIPEILGFPPKDTGFTRFAPLAPVAKMSQIKSPGSRIVFLDEGYASYAGYTIPSFKPQWHDYPPVRHDNGVTLGYVDGHADFFKWRDPRTIELGKSRDDETITRKFTHNDPVSTDLIMMQTGIFGKLVYDPTD